MTNTFVPHGALNETAAGAAKPIADAASGMMQETSAAAMRAQLEGSEAVEARAEPAKADPRGQTLKKVLRTRLGEEVYNSWFHSMDLEAVEAGVVRLSVPVKFLRNWIQSHYAEDLLNACRAEFKEVDRVEVVLRQPGPARPVRTDASLDARPAPVSQPTGTSAGLRPTSTQPPVRPAQTSLPGRTQAGGLEGSPLDPRYTFESFIIGAANRMAHAGATTVAETVFSDSRGFNPLYIHSAVGLGKTHLLHAIAWDVKRRAPHAQVLYLTAERFRYHFVDALRSQDPLAFKDRFRQIDVLLIDDLEFLHGQQTEQEFDHIINSLLDGGKQVVVASARAPNHIDRLNERMRSRLQRGLVTEITGFDYELRLKVLERRSAEKRAIDPSFEIGRDVLELLAERLTDSGRELEGAVTRLHAAWQYMKTPVSLDFAETVIRDLVQGAEPRRIKIEDILKVVSRHYGVSRADLLSQRRHRSVVWPRQIGMYLAKQMTSRSLPEIGRRFGGRDHTTVLHAIRKIEGALDGNARLKDELEELRKLLNT